MKNYLPKRLSFNHDWLFQLGDTINGEAPALNEESWRKLNLPHDWSIEYPVDERNRTGGGGFAKAGVA